MERQRTVSKAPRSSPYEEGARRCVKAAVHEGVGGELGGKACGEVCEVWEVVCAEGGSPRPVCLPKAAPAQC